MIDPRAYALATGFTLGVGACAGREGDWPTAWFLFLLAFGCFIGALRG